MKNSKAVVYMSLHDGLTFGYTINTTNFAIGMGFHQQHRHRTTAVHRLQVTCTFVTLSRLFTFCLISLVLHVLHPLHLLGVMECKGVPLLLSKCFSIGVNLKRKSIRYSLTVTLELKLLSFSFLY